jgi:hypothetical protein
MQMYTLSRSSADCDCDEEESTVVVGLRGGIGEMLASAGGMGRGGERGQMPAAVVAAASSRRR